MIKYATNKKLVLFFLNIIDKIFVPFLQNKTNPIHISEKVNILLVNSAHIGDLIISSNLIKIIKDKYPKSQISFIASSWSKIVIEDNKKIDSIFIIDHWYYNRSNKFFLIKLLTYFYTIAKNFAKIKNSKFDIAIVLNSFYPSITPYLKSIGIKKIIGYSTAGFGGLLSHRLNNVDCSKHEFEIQLELLKFLSIENINLKNFKLTNDNPPTNPSDFLLSNYEKFKEKPYIIIHIGSGAIIREWPINRWSVIVNYLDNLNEFLIFTGKGKRESFNVKKIVTKNSINFTDSLNWSDLKFIIRNAKLVFGVESMIGHLASCYDVPSISIFDNQKNINRWKPMGRKSFIVSSLDGVNGVSVESVINVYNNVFNHK